MESLPSLSVITMGCLVMPPTPMMAEFGWLIMGNPNTAPNWPGLVMVKVEPSTSVGMSFLLRARSPRSEMPRCRPRKLSSSAFLRTGTINPQSSATAIPAFTWRW